MRLKYALLIGLSLMMLLVTGCDTVLNQFGVVSQHQTDEARKRLDSMFHRLPTVPGAILLQRGEGSGGGQNEACTSIVIQELYGTNKLSFQEILDLYTGSLLGLGGRLRFSAADGRGFDIDELAFAVSGSEAEGPWMDQGLARDAKNKFRTVYLIELNTLVLQPMPAQCRDEP